MEVPYGKTASYLDLAKAIGNEKSVRAVAGANGANAIAIIIPCHRILGSNGELVGYAGGLAVKKQLLDLEQGHLSLFGSQV
jgi:methylated-DNA-[protein]-cysteine S-methyltransferase